MRTTRFSEQKTPRLPGGAALWCRRPACKGSPDGCPTINVASFLADAHVVEETRVLASGWRLSFLMILMTFAVAPLTASADDAVGVRVPGGFSANLFADDDLAHDIYAMTIDSFGRVVVSGAGYVRILIDNDGDGKADQFKQFADGPRSGAQGMCFVGRDLLCVGDGGLLRYRDQNGDDRADGPPDVFLKLKTGSEHHAHSLQRGPDGWWYLICGNHAEITETYATLPNSVIKKPRAGTILRMKPDLSAGEILAHGFRNAYDFAFNAQGDLFTFDSDGERDISLPWYRPTRVFHVPMGSDAGWMSRSWKRPSTFLDMPPEIAEFGRGSPTGVACYRHWRFPQKYQDAIFVLDWTFGRVMALPLRTRGSSYASEPVRFMTAVDQFGFAPTDVEIGRDGSLYVSVGGRGTRGGVFRVTHQDPLAEPPAGSAQRFWRVVQSGSTPPSQSQPPNVSEQQAGVLEPQAPRDALLATLVAPQPLSSWSRARWMPWAAAVGRDAFVEAARDPELPVAARMRAVEVATELFGGLDHETLAELATVDSVTLRARAAWSIGRVSSASPNTDALSKYVGDEDPLVARVALEAVLGADSKTNLEPLVPGIVRGLGSSDRFLRQAASRVVPRLDKDAFKQVSIEAGQSGWQAGLANAVGFLDRKPGFNAYAFTIGLSVLEEEHPASLKVQAVRLMQLGLGDVGPREATLAVFDGYASRLDLGDHERDLDPVLIRLTKQFPTGDREVDYELARLLGMLKPFNHKLLDSVLAQITEESHPVDDIHFLIVANRFPISRTRSQQEIIAKALVNLEAKLVARQLKQDTNWDVRIGEMYAEHVKLDDTLPAALLQQPGFGLPGHVVFLGQLPPELLMTAIAAFEKRVNEDDNYLWDNNVLFVFGESQEAQHRQLVRKQFDNFAVRSAVLMILAEGPEEQDRDKFLAGLESSQIEVLTACVQALSKLPDEDQPLEIIGLVRVCRRLGNDAREYVLREEVVELLRRRTKQSFGFELGKAGYRPQSEVIQRWTEWVGQMYPDQIEQVEGGSTDDLSRLNNLLAEVDWEQGSPSRGLVLFTARACGQCHGGRRALGPDLAGVAGRFSRQDLFTAIALPNRDVSPRYQTTLIQTVEGKVRTGLVVYEAVDGLLIRDARNQTFRVEAADIEFRRMLPQSLMPSGLLKDLEPQDLADLYAYLQSLGNRNAEASAPNANEKR